jgi:predicted TIM-barrel enzyme
MTGATTGATIGATATIVGATATTGASAKADRLGSARRR